MVRQDVQGQGVGRALLEEVKRAAQLSGLDELVLVTTSDLVGTAFYLHLGWQCTGELTSRSGENFVGYRLPLRQGDPPFLTFS